MLLGLSGLVGFAGRFFSSVRFCRWWVSSGKVLASISCADVVYKRVYAPFVCLSVTYGWDQANEIWKTMSLIVIIYTNFAILSPFIVTVCVIDTYRCCQSCRMTKVHCHRLRPHGDLTTFLVLTVLDSLSSYSRSWQSSFSFLDLPTTCYMTNSADLPPL